MMFTLKKPPPPDHTKVTPPVLYHEGHAFNENPHNSWEFLCLWQVVHDDKVGWETAGGRSCFGALTWGKRVALQLRVPTTVDSKLWKGPYLRSVTCKDHAVRRKIIEAAQDWFMFVTDPDNSPWRGCLKNYTLFGDDKGFTGVLFNDCSAPRPLMHNIFIALRWAWEHPAALLRWHEFFKISNDPFAATFYAQWHDEVEIKGERYITSFRSLSHTWGHSYEDDLVVPSISALIIPPLSKIEQQPFSTQINTFADIQSNKLWNFTSVQSRHPDLQLLSEFDPSKVTAHNSVYGIIQCSKIPYADFIAGLPGAGVRRREIEARVIGRKFKIKEVR